MIYFKILIGPVSLESMVKTTAHMLPPVDIQTHLNKKLLIWNGYVL